MKLITLKAGLHVRRKHKHKHKHKPRVNRDDASTSTSARSFFLCLCLRRPGSHVAYACACAYACVVRVNQPLGVQIARAFTPWLWTGTRLTRPFPSTGHRSGQLAPSLSLRLWWLQHFNDAFLQRVTCAVHMSPGRHIGHSQHQGWRVSHSSEALIEPFTPKLTKYILPTL